MSFATTMLPRIQRAYEGLIDKNELRQKRFGMLNRFRQDTADNGIFTAEDIAVLKESPVGRQVNFPTIVHRPGDYTLTDGKPNDLNPAFAERLSANVTPTFEDKWFAITMSFGEHQNQSISYINKFARELRAWDIALATQINADCIAAVEAARTQVVSNSFGTPFDGIAHIANFANTDRLQFAGKLSRMLSANDYFGQGYSMVGNEGVAYIADLMLQRRETNDQNIARQLGEFGDILISNAIADASNKQATGYAMVNGNTALVEQIARQNRAGLRSLDGRQWLTMVLPISGIEVNVLYGSKANIPGGTVTDNQNNPLDLQETWIFWARYTVNTAYNSAVATNASPIIKFDVAV
jgi:hypothetical protein